MESKISDKSLAEFIGSNILTLNLMNKIKKNSLLSRATPEEKNKIAIDLIRQSLEDVERKELRLKRARFLTNDKRFHKFVAIPPIMRYVRDEVMTLSKSLEMCYNEFRDLEKNTITEVRTLKSLIK